MGGGERVMRGTGFPPTLDLGVVCLRWETGGDHLSETGSKIPHCSWGEGCPNSPPKTYRESPKKWEEELEKCS